MTDNCTCPNCRRLEQVVANYGQAIQDLRILADALLSDLDAERARCGRIVADLERAEERNAGLVMALVTAP